MLSGKNITRVSMARMRRAFVRTNGLKTRTDVWIETGHYFQGVQLTAAEIYETDGDANIAERPGFFEIEGQAAPSQNSVGDFEFYDRFLSGRQSYAFWCDDNQLWLFK